MSFQFSAEAQKDLSSILEYVRRRDRVAASKLRHEFLVACERLGQHPRIGHTRTDLTARDLRFWSVRHWLVIHKSSSPVEIVAVVDGRRDVSALLD